VRPVTGDARPPPADTAWYRPSRIVDGRVRRLPQAHPRPFPARPRLPQAHPRPFPARPRPPQTEHMFINRDNVHYWQAGGPISGSWITTPHIPRVAIHDHRNGARLLPRMPDSSRFVIPAVGWLPRRVVTVTGHAPLAR